MSRSIEELLEAKKNIEQELNKALASKRKEVVAEVINLIKLHNLTAKDLGFKGKSDTLKVSDTKPKSEGSKVSVSRGTYMNPETGKEFKYEKGRPPTWLVEMMRAKTSSQPAE